MKTRRREKENEIWDQLARDMKVAVNRVFSPLNVVCIAYKEWRCIDYQPPFYLEENCTEIRFAIKIKCKYVEIPKYPLTCTSDYYDKGEFIIQSPEDWENHTDKFIWRKSEIEELLKKIKSTT